MPDGGPAKAKKTMPPTTNEGVHGITIQLTAEIRERLKERAQLEGLSLEVFVRRVVEKSVLSDSEEGPKLPLKSVRGLLKDLGPAPSEEDIRRNRAEMFRDFGDSKESLHMSPIPTPRSGTCSTTND